MNVKALFCAIVTSMMLSAVPTQAQGLGGLLKKAKKTVETISGKTTEPASAMKTEKQAMASLPKIPIASGGYMINPLAKVMDVELVGCYGKSKSNNFGDVYLVLKVKMNIVKSSISIGNSIGREGKSMAMDSDGNQYFIDNDAGVNVVEGMFVRLNLNDEEKNQHFVDVPKKVTNFPLVKLGFYIDAAYREYIELHDIPIIWDKTPE